MTREINVKDLVADQGEKKSGLVTVFSTGTYDINIPVTIVNGKREGPVLTLTAGFHPHEYTPIESLIRLSRSMDPADVSGALIIFPLLNPEGFTKRERNNPLDELNMQREFPGSATGRPSQQITWFLSSEILKKSDYYIDNHGADFEEGSTNYVIYPIVGDKRVDDACVMMGKCFNGTYLRGHKMKDTSSNIFWAAANGIPTVLSESGQMGGLKDGQLNEDDIKWELDGLSNVMKSLKMIEGTPQIKEPVMIYKETQLMASVGGMFYPHVKIYDKVVPGQVVGEIKDVFGNVKETLKSPISGAVNLMWFYTAAEVGRPLIQILEC